MYNNTHNKKKPTPCFYPRLPSLIHWNIMHTENIATQRRKIMKENIEKRGLIFCLDFVALQVYL